MPDAPLSNWITKSPAVLIPPTTLSSLASLLTVVGLTAVSPTTTPPAELYSLW